MSHDVVIRNGLVVDGYGGEPRVTDVAIDGDRITAIGDDLPPGTLDIDAEGLTVTPGFVDIHTHLDAQLWWDPAGSPATWHGITSTVIGNCGVTFAPCRPESREYLATMMESVEDIPARSILEGLPWNWSTYGEFLTKLGQRPLGPNVGGLIGHCAMRYFAMGDASLGSTAAPAEAQELMEVSLLEALEAGALGFSASRTKLHVIPDGTPVPGTFAPMIELTAFADVMAKAGRGVIGVATRLHEEDGTTVDETLAAIHDLCQLALDSGRPLTFNLTQGNVEDLHERILEVVHSYRNRGADVRPQTAVRPVGWLYGIGHRSPFDRNPSWRVLRELPMAEKLELLRDPDHRRAMISEVEANPPAVDLEHLFALPPGPARYDLGSEHSLAQLARNRQISAAEMYIDLALESNGTQILTWPIFNADFDAIELMIKDPSTLIGLADSGAHVGQIMDASQPSYLLSYWVRDRGTLSLAEAVRRITSDPADVFGLVGRGRLEVGAFADVNVIDVDGIQLDHPEFVHDLPNGAGRFVQRASGYHWTFVNGQALRAHGKMTDVLAGVLLTPEG